VHNDVVAVFVDGQNCALDSAVALLVGGGRSDPPGSGRAARRSGHALPPSGCSGPSCWGCVAALPLYFLIQLGRRMLHVRASRRRRCSSPSPWDSSGPAPRSWPRSVSGPSRSSGSATPRWFSAGAASGPAGVGSASTPRCVLLLRPLAPGRLDRRCDPATARSWRPAGEVSLAHSARKPRAVDGRDVAAALRRRCVAFGWVCCGGRLSNRRSHMICFGP